MVSFTIYRSERTDPVHTADRYERESIMQFTTIDPLDIESLSELETTVSLYLQCLTLLKAHEHYEVRIGDWKGTVGDVLRIAYEDEDED